MAAHKSPIINICITSNRLLVAGCLALLVLAGLWYIQHPTARWAVEGFESLCNNIDGNGTNISSVSYESSPLPTVKAMRPSTDKDKQILQDIVSRVVEPSVETTGEVPISEILAKNESATACELLDRPPTLTPEQSDTATALDRELSNQILPSTADARQELYDSVRQALIANTAIPDTVSKDISNEDARAVILVVALEQQAVSGNLSADEAIKARRILEAKGFAESPKRGILQQLARQMAPVELNSAMANGGVRSVDPSIIAAFSEAATATSFTNDNQFKRQDALTYSRHRALFT